MGVKPRRRRARVRRAAALVTGACLVIACSGQHAPERTAAPQRTAGATAQPEASARSRSPAPRGGTAEAPLPTTPARDDAAALATQLERAAATLRDRQASAAEVRNAGELQQLAVHTLA